MRYFHPQDLKDFLDQRITVARRIANSSMGAMSEGERLAIDDLTIRPLGSKTAGCRSGTSAVPEMIFRDVSETGGRPHLDRTALPLLSHSNAQALLAEGASPTRLHHGAACRKGSCPRKRRSMIQSAEAPHDGMLQRIKKRLLLVFGRVVRSPRAARPRVSDESDQMALDPAPPP